MSAHPVSSDTTSTDRLERSIHIRAPRSRVWRALSEAEQFGRWFGANLAGQQFAAGQRTQGPFTMEGCTDHFFSVLVERVEPESLMSWRWHPGTKDQAAFAHEQPTLVTFTLRDAPDGTLLTVVESGFDQLPPERRFDAFRMNNGGWAAQLQNLQRHAVAP